MLKIQSFTFNPFQENTYLLINENKECLIIDPGMYGHEENRQLISFIENNQLMPQKIINTHAHIDHVLGVDILKEKFDISFGIHKDDLPVLSGAMGSALLFGIDFRNVPAVDFYIEEGSTIKFGNTEIEVRLAPGHSPGSVVFYVAEQNFVIGGDVLFQGSVGRTDLPGGSSDVLFNSIKTQLYSLPDNTTIYAGHGPATQIGLEKRTNPFVKG